MSWFDEEFSQEVLDQAEKEISGLLHRAFDVGDAENFLRSVMYRAVTPPNLRVETPRVFIDQLDDDSLASQKAIERIEGQDQVDWELDAQQYVRLLSIRQILCTCLLLISITWVYRAILYPTIQDDPIQLFLIVMAAIVTPSVLGTYIYRLEGNH